MNANRGLGLFLAAVLVIVGSWSLGSIVETLDATEIMVVQDALDGELHWHTTPGIKAQLFGKVTKYKRRSQYWFSQKEGTEPVHVRFNDGGNADIHGSIALEMPLDIPNLTKIHFKYGSQAAVDRDLIRTIVDKAVYFTGPTMSSKESYSDRRPELIALVQDQVNHGVYQTQSKEVEKKDELSGNKKTVTVAAIVKDDKGVAQRQEASPLEEFGIHAFNFSINSVTYDKTVEGQIQQQQAAIMSVQTAIAAAKQAEQATITTEEQGKAKAATAKWEQEVIKAKEVTAAQQRLEVARLDTQSAEQEKRKQILLGEGEAERRKLVMSADGALQVKVDAWVKSQELWAAAFANHKGRLVPEVVTGGGGSANGLGTAQGFMELLGVKAAKDLALDMQTAGRDATK